MNDFMERNLQKALERKDAPEGFTSRVLERLPARRPRTPSYWLPALAAMLVLALLFTGWERQRRMQEKSARETERQVVFALALAMEKFQHVNDHLQRSAPKVKVQERQGTI